MSSAVRQRSTRSLSVSISMMSCAAAIRRFRISLSGISGERISPSGGISAGPTAHLRDRTDLLNRGRAEQVPYGGEEVRLGVYAVLGAELEELRPERGDEIDVDRRLAGEIAHDAGKFPDHAGRGAARVDLEAYLAPLRHRLERRDL